MHNGIKVSRNSGIDGLRALCVVAVILYHLNLPWVPSGHMGVVVFLVLSGYFTTSTIMRLMEAERRAAIVSLFRAWGRRLLRIVPSVVALVAIVGTICAVGNHVLLTKMRPDVLPSLGFYLNWSYILRNVSYFDLIGGTSPLLHLWYLGVDLQFYFVWTLALFVLVRISTPVARRVALLLAIASGVWMAYMYVPGADPSRIYYGTDTRAFSLLLGSWLALAFPLGQRPQLFAKALVRPPKDKDAKDAPEFRATIFASFLGLLALGGIVASMILLPADSDIWYRGGMFAFSALVVILMATMLAPRSLLGIILGLAPFRVLGARAFALYLWHYPIFLLMGANKSTTVWWMRLAAIAISLVAAELSLRLVERPFAPKTHSPKAERSTASHETKPQFHRPKLAIVFSTIVIAATGAYTYYALANTPDESLVPKESLVSTGTGASQAMDLSQMKSDSSSSSASATSSSSASASSSSSKQDSNANKDKDKKVQVTERTIVHAPATEVSKGIRDPVLIGDSVPGDAGDEFIYTGLGWDTRLPDALVDTFIGRRPDQALEVLQGYLDQSAVGQVVVMACFSNSTPYPETLEAMVNAIGPQRRLYLVGTVNPDGFQDEANENLKNAAKAHDNVYYVDWPSVLEGHLEEYLWADATHLRPEGASVYVDMIVRAIAQDVVDSGGSVGEA